MGARMKLSGFALCQPPQPLPAHDLPQGRVHGLGRALGAEHFLRLSDEIEIHVHGRTLDHAKSIRIRERK